MFPSTVPLAALPNAQYTVADRLHVESQTIATWEPCLNTVGLFSIQHQHRRTFSLITPKADSRHALMKFRGKPKRDPCDSISDKYLLKPITCPTDPSCAYGWRRRRRHYPLQAKRSHSAGKKENQREWQKCLAHPDAAIIAVKLSSQLLKT